MRRSFRQLNLRRCSRHGCGGTIQENALAALERQNARPVWRSSISPNPTRPASASPIRRRPCARRWLRPAPRSIDRRRAGWRRRARRWRATTSARARPSPPSRSILTASSSESYAFLFKLLCDPGDAVLVPEPSYPLFEYLARLEGVRPVGYRLAYHGGAWQIDFSSLDAALARAAERRRACARWWWSTRTTRPAPSSTRGDLRAAGGALPGARTWRSSRTRSSRPIVSTATTAMTRPGPASPPRRADRRDAGLQPGRPVEGVRPSPAQARLDRGRRPARGAEAALARLELIADTYLSVGTPVQLALPRLLEVGKEIARAIRGRLAAKPRPAARRAARHLALHPPRRPGGWTAILRVPALATAASAPRPATSVGHQPAARRRRAGSPGYLYDMPAGAYLIAACSPIRRSSPRGSRESSRAAENSFHNGACSLIPAFALVVAAPAGPDQGCPSPRQITEALNARMSDLGHPRTPRARTRADCAWWSRAESPASRSRSSCSTRNGEVRLQRNLTPVPREHGNDCPALAETVALIVDRYLHDVGYELPPTPPPPAAVREPKPEPEHKSEPPPEPAPQVESEPQTLVARSPPRPTAPSTASFDVLVAGDWRGASDGHDWEADLGIGIQQPIGARRVGLTLTGGLAPARSAPVTRRHRHAAAISAPPGPVPGAARRTRLAGAGCRRGGRLAVDVGAMDGGFGQLHAGQPGRRSGARISRGAGGWAVFAGQRVAGFSGSLSIRGAGVLHGAGRGGGRLASFHDTAHLRKVGIGAGVFFSVMKRARNASNLGTRIFY